MAIELAPLEKAPFPILMLAPNSVFAFSPIAIDECPDAVAFVPMAKEFDF